MSKSPEDGCAKILRAVGDGVDTVIVVGGDGMVNSIGSVLMDTSVALAVIPAGSGNGFARHFNIPLNPERAAKALMGGYRMSIDVGMADGHPFFVTCGLAWDAELTRGFHESPVRGILPYVISGISGYFTYTPQNYDLILDGELFTAKAPMLCTIANLTQYGGGAMIAPDAEPDDGYLMLVVVPHMDPVYLLTQIHRLFNGTLKKAEGVVMRKFKRLEIIRHREDPIQLDGELVPVQKDFVIDVKPLALQAIVPEFWRKGRE